MDNLVNDRRCPISFCGAGPGEPCVSSNGRIRSPHAARGRGDDELRLQAATVGEALERMASQPEALTTDQRRRIEAMVRATVETYTVVGVWDGTLPVPVAVIRGEHEVAGGQSERFDGLWATSVEAMDVDTAEHLAVAAMRGQNG